MQPRIISAVLLILFISCKDDSKSEKTVSSARNDSEIEHQKPLEESSDSVYDTPKDTEEPAHEPEKQRVATPEEALLAALSTGRVVRAIPISKRSLSLKVWLDNGNKAVFKPMLKQSRRAIHEVAVFRMATFLQVWGVPPSTMRAFPLHSLTGHIQKRFPEMAKRLKQNALTDNRGMVSGALIHWIDNLDERHLKKMGGLSGLTKPLKTMAAAEQDHPLTRRTSDMIVFDYVTGNWDRFSGGNLFVSSDGDGLVLIDNNATFAPWSDRQQNRMDELLSRTKRFTAPLIEKLSKMTVEAMGQVLISNREATAQILLTNGEIELLLDRRDRVVSHVVQVVEQHGGEKVFFPQ